MQLNDASLTYEPETSVALGFGFRCGFLGLLHMEIIQERLEREYDLDLITTAPSVIYRITLNDGSVLMIDNPTNYPDPGSIAKACLLYTSLVKIGFLVTCLNWLLSKQSYPIYSVLSTMWTRGSCGGCKPNVRKR